jgi:uncharacterized protein (DUF952 family)
MTRVYKIMGQDDWGSALATGVFTGSAVDVRDGFIHLSTADQAQETARRHFAGRDDLVLVAYEAATLGEALTWEPSRGGALFPHLYGPLPTAASLDVRRLLLGADGAPEIGFLPA